MRAVKVKNLNKKHKLNEKFLENIALDILKILKKHKASIEITFLSDTDIRSINKKYKGRDRPTDVLSFELGELGEILISSDTALKNSRRFGTSFEEEIVLYVIHGILHLHGYDDETAQEKKRMSKKEEFILKRLCQKKLSKVLMPR